MLRLIAAVVFLVLPGLSSAGEGLIDWSALDVGQYRILRADTGEVLVGRYAGSAGGEHVFEIRKPSGTAGRGDRLILDGTGRLLRIEQDRMPAAPGFQANVQDCSRSDALCLFAPPQPFAENARAPFATTSDQNFFRWDGSGNVVITRPRGRPGTTSHGIRQIEFVQ